MGSAGLVLPAGAAVNAPHSIFVLKNESIISAEGFADGELVRAEVRRNGVVIGSVEEVSDGTFEANHDFCWDGVTPQILPGDRVVFTSPADGATPVVDTVSITDIEVKRGPTVARPGSGVGTIKGHVTGPRPPVGELEVFLRSEDPVRFRPIAPGAENGVRGTISYDSGPGTRAGDFTARFTGMTRQQEQQFANPGEFYVAHAPAANEMVQATEGNPAPGPGCSVEAPTARRSVTGLSLRAINARNVAQGLTVRGTTHNSSAVDVRLSDNDPGTTGAAPVANAEVGTADARGRASWTAVFSAADLRGLNGTIRVNAVHVDSATQTRLRGTGMTISKDTVAPARPRANPRRGTFRRAVSVTLRTAAANRIRFTLGNGTQPAPTATSGLRYRRQVRITASQTLKAVAIDSAGNVSPVTRGVYRIR